MKASPNEPERDEDGDDESRPVVRASPQEGDDDQSREETIEEPGYGHGV